MELSKKTTILLSPEMHRSLSRIAAERGTSLGALVREACERSYGERSAEERKRAVRELAELDLPVGTPEELEAEAVPEPDDGPP